MRKGVRKKDESGENSITTSNNTDKLGLNIAKMGVTWGVK